MLSSTSGSVHTASLPGSLYNQDRYQVNRATNTQLWQEAVTKVACETFFISSGLTTIPFSASPRVVLDRIPLGNKELVRREPKILRPSVSECGQYLAVFVPDIEMEILEESVEELQRAIEAVVRTLWKHYASLENENLSQKVLEFKRRIINTYKVCSL